MSRIRGRDTKIEIKTGALLRSAGIRFKRHPKIYGNPDFLVGERTAPSSATETFGTVIGTRRGAPVSSGSGRDKIERNMSGTGA